MELSKKEYWSETFRGLDFSGVTIESKEFDGCTFAQCDFSEALIKRCKFADCQFVGCNLSLVKVDYSKFSDVEFRESKLVGVNWTNVDWPRMLFSSPVKFYQSIINDSSFCGLSLQELVLEECKAHDVDFRDGDFSNANFSYTDFSGSLFNNTKLAGANFAEAVNYDIDIYQNILKGAKFSRFEAVRLLDSLGIELVD